MRALLVLLALMPIGVTSAAPETLALLRQELSVKYISNREVRACIVGWCDVYRTLTDEGEAMLPEFMFLYTWHVTGFGIRPLARRGEPPFKSVHGADEQRIRSRLAHYCATGGDDAKCILRGMRDQLAIVVSGGKYDEGSFNETSVPDALALDQD